MLQTTLTSPMPDKPGNENKNTGTILKASGGKVPEQNSHDHPITDDSTTATTQEPTTGS
jgi:hypothetical protein